MSLRIAGLALLLTFAAGTVEAQPFKTLSEGVQNAGHTVGNGLENGAHKTGRALGTEGKDEHRSTQASQSRHPTHTHHQSTTRAYHSSRPPAD